MDIINIVLIIFGCLAGAQMCFISKMLIEKRTGEPANGLMLNHKFSIMFWILLTIIGSLLIILITNDFLKIVVYIITFIVLLSIAVIDGNIRKIPNPLLLVLIILKVAIIVIYGAWGDVFPSLIGAIAGWFLFLLPSKFGTSIGWGDVKMATVMGFYLGIVGMLQAVVIMGVFLGIYGAYLTITKKGSFKSEVAIGPPLSLGMFIALLSPMQAFV